MTHDGRTKTLPHDDDALLPQHRQEHQQYHYNHGRSFPRHGPLFPSPRPQSDGALQPADAPSRQGTIGAEEGVTGGWGPRTTRRRRSLASGGGSGHSPLS